MGPEQEQRLEIVQERVNKTDRLKKNGQFRWEVCNREFWYG